MKEFLNDIRIQKAQESILLTDKQIIHTAYEYGFNSIRTSNRVFKTDTGFDPANIGSLL